MDIESIQSALTFYHLEGAEYGDKDTEEMFQKLNGPEEVAGYASGLKTEGNLLFKQDNFTLAYSCYRKAVKAICFVVSLDAAGQELIKDLAVSLNLNLAFCALKLCDFHQTHALCSLVLKFDSQNVKALFRRACASINLGLFMDAYSDLIKAKSLEGNNKDVLKELAKVEGWLQISATGLVRPDQVSHTAKGKAVLVECAGSSDFSEIISSSSSSSSSDEFPLSSCVTSTTTSDVVDEMKVDGPNASEAFERINSQGSMDQSTFAGNVPSRSPEVDMQPPHVFVNRRQPSKSLSISPVGLDQLTNGQELLFYHSRSGSVLRVRATTTSTQILTEAPHDLESGEAAASTPLSNTRDVILPPLAQDSENAVLTPSTTRSTTTTSSDASPPVKRQKVVPSPPPCFRFSATPRRKFCRSSHHRFSSGDSHTKHRRKAAHPQHRQAKCSPQRPLCGTKRKAVCYDHLPLLPLKEKKKLFVYSCFNFNNVFCLEGLEFHPGISSFCRTLPSFV